MRLEEVLADWREKANTLRVTRSHVTADTLDQALTEIERAGERYLRWLNEVDAQLYGNRSLRWLRAHYAGWELEGMAKKVSGKRFYLMAALPSSPNSDAILAQAERDEMGDAA